MQLVLLAWAERWRVDLIEVDVAKTMVSRVRHGRLEEYAGPLHGFQLQPHAECEMLRFTFDDGLYLADCCKTQFAPVEIHMEVIDLLRAIKPLFADLKVLDEGGYWDTNDRDELETRIGFLNRAIDRLTHAFPPAPDEILRRFDRTLRSGEN